ncbi:MAG: YbaB/EbfC family nucleoid-associated protein [Oscillospiraceae bacterium]|nr:YbaB/EbfC family nucleoid-associated protein [Oscillospiraceae bacterium]
MKARLPQGMGGGAQNMNGMIKQAQKMQAQITAIQEDIENREFKTTAGGGAVEVVMSGRKEIKSLTIQPDVVDKDDIEMLQDLVISAFNDAVHQIEETSEKEMGAVTGGVSFPGLF